MALRSRPDTSPKRERGIEHPSLALRACVRGSVPTFARASALCPEFGPLALTAFGMNEPLLSGGRRLDPGGVAAISRWLSAAIPPVHGRRGEHRPRRGRSVAPGEGAATPEGSAATAAAGGSAALNHRQMAATPPGSKYHLLPLGFILSGRSEGCGTQKRARSRRDYPRWKSIQFTVIDFGFSANNALGNVTSK